MASFNFTTGPSPLADIGICSYNGCTFSPLFESSVSGKAVQDAANRTTRFMEYSLAVDGYVTLPDNLNGKADGVGTTTAEMVQLRNLLTAQGGVLVYTGRGNDIVVNGPGGQTNDVAWGPIPDLLDFTPLGAGRCAKVKWAVKTRIFEGKIDLNSPVQFNQETSVVYDEAQYSTLSIRGTLEMPLTRFQQNARNLQGTVDDLREEWFGKVTKTIDLTRFRVTHREINISRDKRVMEWSITAEELPYMGLPANVTIARGNFSFRPAKTGMGMATWLCTLRVTYTVRKDCPRRMAWLAFLALLRLRMNASVDAFIPVPQNQNPGPQPNVGALFGLVGLIAGQAPAVFGGRVVNAQNQLAKKSKAALLVDFSGEEGLYLDSKTTTFSATWRLTTAFTEILLASGLWRKVPTDGGDTWAMSIADISGWRSWDENTLDPTQDAIVDMGG